MANQVRQRCSDGVLSWCPARHHGGGCPGHAGRGHVQLRDPGPLRPRDGDAPGAAGARHVHGRHRDDDRAGRGSAGHAGAVGRASSGCPLRRELQPGSWVRRNRAEDPLGNTRRYAVAGGYQDTRPARGLVCERGRHARRSDSPRLLSRCQGHGPGRGTASGDHRPYPPDRTNRGLPPGDRDSLGDLEQGPGGGTGCEVFPEEPQAGRPEGVPGRARVDRGKPCRVPGGGCQPPGNERPGLLLCLRRPLGGSVLARRPRDGNHSRREPGRRYRHHRGHGRRGGRRLPWSRGPSPALDTSTRGRGQGKRVYRRTRRPAPRYRFSAPPQIEAHPRTGCGPGFFVGKLTNSGVCSDEDKGKLHPE